MLDRPKNLKKLIRKGLVSNISSCPVRCQTAEISGKMHEILQSVWQRTTSHGGVEPPVRTKFLRGCHLKNK